MKFKLSIILVLFLIAQTRLQAQDNSGTSYKSALGIKFYPGAISFKHNINNKTSLEAIDYFWKGNRITGLYEMHYNIGDLDGLRWFIGPGAHLSFYDDSHNNGVTLLGLDGIIGLDWKINNAPLDLSLDWQPSFEFSGDYMFVGDWLCFSVRYVF